MINIATQKGFARYLQGKKIVGVDFGKDWGMPDKVIFELENGGRLQFFARESECEFGEPLEPHVVISYWKAKEASND